MHPMQGRETKDSSIRPNKNVILANHNITHRLVVDSFKSKIAFPPILNKVSSGRDQTRNMILG